MPGMSFSVLAPPPMPPTTQAAEGLPRRKWRVSEIEAMVAAGIILEDERFEMIGGEIVPMSPKGIQHEVLKGELLAFWLKRLPEAFRLIPETTFRFDAFTFVEPDVVFYPAEMRLRDLSPKNALLAIEVADSSLAYDLGRKARLYAGAGLRELWVMNAMSRETTRLSDPGDAGFASRRLVGPTEALALPFWPDIAVRLDELATE
jgi:Uma2 family endonuclease